MAGWHAPAGGQATLMRVVRHCTKVGEGNAVHKRRAVSSMEPAVMPVRKQVPYATNRVTRATWCVRASDACPTCLPVVVEATTAIAEVQEARGLPVHDEPTRNHRIHSLLHGPAMTAPYSERHRHTRKRKRHLGTTAPYSELQRPRSLSEVVVVPAWKSGRCSRRMSSRTASLRAA